MRKKGQRFECELLPEHRFRIPFPVPSSITSNTIDLSTTLLEFDTKSCTLLLAKSFRSIDPFMESLSASSICLIVHLHDHRGRWAGVVESLFLDDAEYVEGTSCELIAISKGRVKRRRRGKKVDYYMDFQPFSEMLVVDELADLKYYSFYNVLWIEWKGGVAYRKALGRVWEDAWDRLTVSDVHISLG
jgi:hypothetical protein